MRVLGSFIEFAVKLGRSKFAQRQNMLESLIMKLSLAGHDCLNQVGINQDFTSLCLNNRDSPAIPVASVLELFSELIQDKNNNAQGHRKRLKCDRNLAQHLQPQDVTVGDLRVWNDLDLIFGELPKNCSTAQWIHELQFHQRPSRQTSLPMNELLITLALMGCLIHWPHIAFIIGFPWSCIVFLNNISVV